MFHLKGASFTIRCTDWYFRFLSFSMPSNLFWTTMTDNTSCYSRLSWQKSCKLVPQLAAYCTLPHNEFHLLLTELFFFFLPLCSVGERLPVCLQLGKDSTKCEQPYKEHSLMWMFSWTINAVHAALVGIRQILEFAGCAKGKVYFCQRSNASFDYAFSMVPAEAQIYRVF